MPLFPAVPEDLSGLSVEELETLRTEIRTQLVALAAGEVEIPEGMSSDDVFAAAAAASAAVAERISPEIDGRAAEEAAGVEELQRLATEAGASMEAEADAEEAEETEEAEEEGADERLATDAETAEPEAEEAEESEPAAIAASGANGNGTVEFVRRRLPATPRRHQPQIVVEENGSRAGALIASSGLPGIEGGTELGRNELAAALWEMHRKTRSVPGSPNIIVASIYHDFPEERTLHADDRLGNSEKLRNALPIFMSEEAIVAAGGLCAPLTPFYDMPQFASADRPVRGANPSFDADRGGVTVPEAGSIGDITTAITTITEAEDAAGGTFATKSCQAFDCPDFTDVAVTAIAHCREYGNLGARAWPEQIAFQNDLTMAAWARTAETYLLNRIKEQSIEVTTTQVYNTIFELVYAIGRAKAAMRYKLRMSRAQRFTLLAPAWLLDLAIADAAASQFDRLEVMTRVQALLEAQGVSVTWYLDDVTFGGDTSQGFIDEVAGSGLDDYPDAAQLALYPTGGFLHLDGGTLELGVVRDSVLNETNQFQVFGESWEEIVRLVPAQAAIWIHADVCPNGVFPALGTALTC